MPTEYIDRPDPNYRDHHPSTDEPTLANNLHSSPYRSSDEECRIQQLPINSIESLHVYEDGVCFIRVKDFDGTIKDVPLGQRGHWEKPVKIVKKDSINGFFSRLLINAYHAIALWIEVRYLK